MTSLNRHGHAATAKAVELYDEPRELEPFERDFYSAVHAINMNHANMVGNAARQWGIGSIAYDAVVDLATRQQDADLTAALEAYQAAVDAGDEVLEVEMMEAAE
jgi:hypothetical protein